MTAMQYFAIAERAFTKISPLMMGMRAHLGINLNFEGRSEGVDIWVHSVSNDRVIDYRLRIQTLDQLDAFVASLELEAKASVTA